MKTKQEVDRIGDEMLAQVKDPRWKKRVWENMGWNVVIENPPISIRYDGRTENHYCILMSGNINKVGHGFPLWTLDKICFPTIIEALAAQAVEALDRVETLQDAALRVGEILAIEAEGKI